MTQLEILDLIGDNRIVGGDRVGPEEQRTRLIGEIALQLALLNERLNSWSWPDGNGGVTTK